MESDKRYFVEGLFVIGFSIALAFFFIWLTRSGNKDDVLYRIHFPESVSGLSLGDPVKYLGVDVGMVEAMTIKPDDPSRVEVDVKLRKDARSGPIPGLPCSSRASPVRILSNSMAAAPKQNTWWRKHRQGRSRKFPRKRAASIP